MTNTSNPSQAVLSTFLLHITGGYLIYTLMLHGSPPELPLPFASPIVMNLDFVFLTWVTCVCSLSCNTRRIYSYCIPITVSLPYATCTVFYARAPGWCVRIPL